MSLQTASLVVLDSNIYFSAIVWGGNPQKVINLWLNGKFILLISPEILFETLTVLGEYGVRKEVIAGFQYQIESHAEKIVPKSKVNICRDAKDNKFLELSKDANADYLVTGDKDLLTLKKFGKTKILKPKDFLGLTKFLSRGSW